MKCISPLFVKAPSVYYPDGRHAVPCGQCNYCLQVKRADWSFRLKQELKVSTSAYFLTMTYDEATCPRSESGVPSLCKEDIQLFLKRLRKENSFYSSQGLRYYTVGEYGTNTGRPHYHSILFNCMPGVVLKVSDIWGKGHTQVGDVTPASIHYTTKYVINRIGDFGDRAPPKAYMSRRPGIGVNYLATHTLWHLAGKRNFTQVNGQIGRLPRYYKDKIFNMEQRYLMAQQALALSDQAYADEIARLVRFDSDACNYYDERDRFNHDAIVSKVNVLNTF